MALVCGSSSGIGFAIAAELAREGARVALNGRDPDRLARAVERLRLAGGKAEGFSADVSHPDDVEGLVSDVTTRLGPPEILICNAGGPPATTFADAPAEAWEGALRLNLLSTINLCRAAVPGMRARKFGRVICLTSIAAKQVAGQLILSTTARAGVLGFAKTLADEVAHDGVTVNVVCPGFMRTERVVELADRRARLEGRTREKVLADVVRAIPTGRIGEPEELAAVVTFLASDRARYVTGTALQVDGGYIRSIV